ncbi:MAG: hypothetical protein JW850_02650 [Thermoflexales bacterium]|nr:hypothetical protein [Thermoflexales bacterium]
MSEEQINQQAESTKATGEAWQEVGKQFQTLGESLAAAFRAALHNEGNRQRLEEMKSGLESIVDEVGKAVKEVAASPETQQARDEAGKALKSVQAAGEQTIQEVRPQLVSALRQINDELKKLVSSLESEATKKPPVSEEAAKPPVEDA